MAAAFLSSHVDTFYSALLLQRNFCLTAELQMIMMRIKSETEEVPESEMGRSREVL